MHNWVVLPLTPLKASLARVRAGGNHWAWDPAEDQLYGTFPRRPGGKAGRARNGFHGHVANSYEDEDGRIVVEITVADGNVFFFFPPDGDRPAGGVAQRNKLSSPMTRWVFDPAALRDGDRVEPARELDFSCEFTRVDERFLGRCYKHWWTLQVDPARPSDAARCGSPGGGLFNVLTHCSWEAPGGRDEWWAGPCATFQELVFIPESGHSPEGCGRLLCLENRLDELRNNIVIFDAVQLLNGPIAVVKLPLKFKLGFHGNWVGHADIEAFQKLRKEGGELGPVRPATDPLPWQIKKQQNQGQSVI